MKPNRLVVVLAPAHLLLGERHSGGLHPDPDLPRPGRGQSAPGHLQAFRLDDPGQDDLYGFSGHDISF